MVQLTLSIAIAPPPISFLRYSKLENLALTNVSVGGYSRYERRILSG